ncbi:MAG: XRE family transcriptional regulator [Ignavibacteriae bacterium HGW-Ignavibacteriae-2]|jgi:AraC family transcriptional regulator of adaptative response/methylated-DNA-[protein]-cysteine methyltransferase|nr:MAG: XRE family transcriptional regulator [Ignavibacteriae bacterium HGW-Ignavibacteriae-2]
MKKTLLPPKQIMYEALINKDASFEGLFFAGIKSTGIFCRPTCTARKPKFENVDYFASTKDALFAGYRACKRCRPLELNGKTPEWLNDLITLVKQDSNKRWKDFELKKAGIDPSRVRRWFKKNHNMTFHAYLRSLRLSNALGNIKHGDDITRAAYSHGFESVSGFREAIKQLIGEPAAKSKLKTIITVNRILTPLGPMIAGATEEGLCLLEFADRRMLETQFKRLIKLFDGSIIVGDNKFIEKVSEEINSYFAGKIKRFTVPIVIPGSDFQRRVWSELKNIPYGATTSYEGIAKKINSPKAIRAVATANGDNRLAIIIPCHRVIGKDGKLHGYGGGLWRKKWLIEHENVINQV